jgi:non-specific serine/threonine protein kinase
MPSQINPNVPASMDNIIRRALEKDLYSRYRNGAEMAQDLSAVRFQVVDDNWVALDTSRLDVLKQLEFFRGFEELELWEVLRISTWREIPADVLLMREGDEESGFGIIIEGEVEVSVEDRVICRLGAGEVVGEMAYLNQDEPRRSASIVTLTSIVYLDINNAALTLATEECFERFQKKLVATAVRRLAAADHSLASYGEQAHKPAATDKLEIELDLEPDEAEPKKEH